MNLRRLTDDDLWNRIAFLAKEERRITLDVLLHLKEIDRRRLHLDRGYSSLYEYALKELRYSEGAAYRRVQAMRLLKDMPEVEEKISSGQLSLSTASKIQSAAKDQPKEAKLELVQQLEGRSAREVDRHLAKDKPAREIVRWISSEEVELKVQISKGPFQNLEELKAIRSNAVTGTPYSKLMEDLIELGQDRWNPLRRTASTTRRSSASSLNPRNLPPSLRMEIWRRDGNQCTYVDPKTGRRCQSKSFLHIDHILPVALGGKAEPGNLRLLCAQHNQHRAERTFGPKPEK
jgi:5-methylcytosine-specific restriction endonuclease McrA